jgi:hypothetical protein
MQQTRQISSPLANSQPVCAGQTKTSAFIPERTGYH